MSEELLINVSPMESRVALLNDGVLREVYIERHNKLGLVGNIYIGTVVRVLPGMQAAFVDIGQSRTAFLHVNDMQKIKKAQPTTQPECADHHDGHNDVKHYHDADHSEGNANDTATEDTTNGKGDINDNHAIHKSSPTAPLSKTKQGTSLTNHAQHQQNTHQQTSHADVKNEPQLLTAIPSTRKIESYFSNKQFTTDYPVTSTISGVSTPYEQALQYEHAAVKNHSNTHINSGIQHNISTGNGVEDANQTPTIISDDECDKQADKKPEFSAIKVLTTVTEVLTKESLTPSVNELSDSMGGGDNVLHNTNDKRPLATYKKQPQANPTELIQNRLRERQQVLVQVTKDQLGTKGARLTTNISLPSRYLVYLPSSDNIGVSQRIEKDDERNRLKTELTKLMKSVDLQGGLIARTAAEGVPVIKLQEDIEYLRQLWRMVEAKKNEVHPHNKPVLIYQELSLPLRSLRDLVHEQTERVVVDDAVMYDCLKQFAHEFVPMILPRIVPYHSQQPMFDVYRVEEDLRDALKRRVDLKSGGYLIIDQTEAMTTIDVNTGSFVGGRSLEDTVYKTNLEATHAIARQLRLRNLGGIIILDFIDMQEQEHRDDVLISLQTQLAEDYARTNITQISELGLVEMTRKRTRESLEQLLCEPCPTCNGKGFIKTSETVCFEIFREIMRCARTYNAPKQFTVVAHASVIDLLLTSEADTVADLEYLIGRVITFEVERLYTQEQYDIVLD